MKQNGIADEMQPDATGSLLSVKMNSHRVQDLLLQFAEVLALCGDAPRTVWSVPGSYEPSRILIPLDLKSDFIHRF